MQQNRPAAEERQNGAQAALNEFTQVQTKVAQVYQDRCSTAFQRYMDAVKAATSAWLETPARPATPFDFWRDINSYWLDFSQRSVLFWDTLRQRGNNWLEHEKAGKPPLLDFDWEMISDARP